MYEVKNRVPNFNLNPYIEVENTYSYGENSEIIDELNNALKNHKIIVFDYYHGIDELRFYDDIISKINADIYVDTNTIKYSEAIISDKFKHFIGEERVNGVIATCKIKDFFDPVLIEEANNRMKNNNIIVIYGVGASSIFKGDLLVYVSLEIQEVKNRYDQGLDNWGAKNFDEEYVRKEKRFHALDMRVQEVHKKYVLEDLDYFLDYNDANHPVMINKEIFEKAMDAFVSQPFSCVPFFSEGIWGGQWIKKVIGAGKELDNVAWGYIGEMDWQAIQAKCGNHFIKMQGKDLLYARPIELLGRQMFFMFGHRCPMTLCYLDTWDGGNLSLQCHPTVAYNQEHFNYPFAHNESYYMIDASDHSSVYLGVKNGVKVKELVNALEEAQITQRFEAEKWVNRIPMKKHDHVFIPSGTIHSSASGTIVLEINSTYHTTFKIWDWGQLDKEGKPRPIDIGHAKHVIQESYDTDFVLDNLVSKQSEVARGYGWKKEHSGLMEYEPLRVERYWFKNALFFETNEHVKILCLVEGEEAIIISPNDAFKPFVMHYGEAIFIPASVGQIYLKPYGKSLGQELAVLEVYHDLGNRY